MLQAIRFDSKDSQLPPCEADEFGIVLFSVSPSSSSQMYEQRFGGPIEEPIDELRTNPPINCLVWVSTPVNVARVSCSISLRAALGFEIFISVMTVGVGDLAAFERRFVDVPHGDLAEVPKRLS